DRCASGERASPGLDRRIHLAKRGRRRRRSGGGVVGQGSRSRVVVGRHDFAQESADAVGVPCHGEGGQRIYRRVQGGGGGWRRSGDEDLLVAGHRRSLGGGQQLLIQLL